MVMIVLFLKKKKDLLLGASTNNLNRVHFGYHYPRDDQTAKQSYKGYKSFKNFFREAIIRNFKNYYLIEENSKVNLKDYLKFCKRNNLEFKEVNINKIKFKTNHVEGGIIVKEPIYDWEEIKKKTKSIIKKVKNNKIKLNESVKKINKLDNYNIITNKGNYDFKIVIDASYERSNSFINNITKVRDKKYQLVVVFEFIPKNFNKMGLALMDGNFFSFLPKGRENKHLLYHVKHSIIKEKVSKEYPKEWDSLKNYTKKINKSKKLILKDFRKYFPDLDILLTKKKYINPRVLLKNVEKNDKRISKINDISKNYIQIFSAKVDHSVDIGYKILKKLKKFK